MGEDRNQRMVYEGQLRGRGLTKAADTLQAPGPGISETPCFLCGQSWPETDSDDPPVHERCLVAARAEAAEIVAWLRSQAERSVFSSYTFAWAADRIEKGEHHG